MSKFYLIVLLIISGLICNGQDLKGVKSIIKYEDTIVRRISSLNTNGNISFWKNNRMNGPVIMMGASYYDSINRKVKSISGHSNVGFSVWTYEFDNKGNEVRVFAYKEPPAPKDEEGGYIFNPYSHIENYTNAQELENDTIVRSIMSSREKYTVFERTFDNNGNELKEISFKENGDVSTVNTNEYDENDNLIRFDYDGGGAWKWTYHHSYDDNGNELSSKRINNRGDTTEVHLYKYDDDNHLIENQYQIRGEIQYTEKYYFRKGHMTRKEIYNSEDKLVREQTFEYNEKGNMIRENYHDMDNNKKIVYFWKYEYY